MVLLLLRMPEPHAVERPQPRRQGLRLDPVDADRAQHGDRAHQGNLVCGEPRAELFHLLVEGHAAAVGHGGLVGEAGVELDEQRPVAVQQVGHAGLQIGHGVDGEGALVAGALGHHHVVHAVAARRPLRSGRVVDVVLEEQVREVAWPDAPDGGQRAELHAERAVPVEDDHAPVGIAEGQPQAERRRAPHEPDAADREVVGGERPPRRRRRHGGNADGVAALRGDQLQHVLRFHRLVHRCLSRWRTWFTDVMRDFDRPLTLPSPPPGARDRLPLPRRGRGLG